jgi:hypothetical protein
MTPSTGSRWNPRRPLAVLATLSASVLIGSAVSQYGATAGFAGPQIPIQDGTSVLLISDPTNCVPRLTDHPARVGKTQPFAIETTPVLLRSPNSLAPAPAASPPRLNEGKARLNLINPTAPAPATSAPRLNEASGCAARISSFNQHRQGPPVSPTPAASAIETTPILLRAPSTAVAPAPATSGSGGSGSGSSRGHAG